MAEEKVDDVLRGLAEKLRSKRLRASDFFRKFDASGDGTISHDELRSGLAELGVHLANDEASALLTRLDKDNDGISIREFEKAMKAAEKLPKKKEVKETPKRRYGQGLTSQDKEEFRQIFGLFKQLCRDRSIDQGDDVHLVDWDASGSISVDALEQLVETVGLHLDASDLEAMIKEMDSDANGQIDFEEFCSVMTKKMQVVEHTPEEIAKAFKAFAKSAPPGLIRVKDLGDALTTFMHKEMTGKEVADLITHYKECFVKLPGDQEEYFNYQEYIDLMSPISMGALTGALD